MPEKTKMKGRLVVLVSKKFLTACAAAGLLLSGSSTLVHAQNGQAPAAATKNWKDRGEYDLYVSITKEADPNKRLALLDEWKSKYPTSDYKIDRDVLYVTTDGQAGKPQETLDAAKAALAEDPENVTVLYWATLDTPYAPANDANYDFGVKSANGLLNAKMPPGMSPTDWEKAKKDLSLEATAHTTLGWVALKKNDNETAEKEFTASLKANPNNGQVSYWKGQAILAQKKPERQGDALYDIARAAAYDGPGAMPTGRDQVKAYFTKVYAQYHGSNEGLDNVLATAKTNSFPPPGFKILSSVDLEKDKAAKAAEQAKSNPMLALWNNMKDQLSSANGQQYFDSGVKDADLPGNAVPGVTKFKGKLVSQEPDTKPKKLVLAIQDGTTPEVTLLLDTPLPGKADPGTEISFSGTAKEFAASPFNLTFAVEKKNIEGWPVKSEPAAPHRTTPRKRTTR